MANVEKGDRLFCRFDGLPHAVQLVGFQLVSRDHVALGEAGNENLLDIGAESIAIHRAAAAE